MAYKLKNINQIKNSSRKLHSHDKKAFFVHYNFTDGSLRLTLLLVLLGNISLLVIVIGPVGVQFRE